MWKFSVCLARREGRPCARHDQRGQNRLDRVADEEGCHEVGPVEAYALAGPTGVQPEGSGDGHRPCETGDVEQRGDHKRRQGRADHAAGNATLSSPTGGPCHEHEAQQETGRGTGECQAVHAVGKNRKTHRTFREVGQQGRRAEARAEGEADSQDRQRLQRHRNRDHRHRSLCGKRDDSRAAQNQQSFANKALLSQCGGEKCSVMAHL
mmetsp:Transcript_3044/g.5181  ORF Transcript_3044/g.5181 Transcript_3044/m.5181 type:complete len:208 (+) Transcript_3044:149-772(+)